MLLEEHFASSNTGPQMSHSDLLMTLMAGASSHGRKMNLLRLWKIYSWNYPQRAGKGGVVTRRSSQALASLAVWDDCALRIARGSTRPFPGWYPATATETMTNSGRDGRQARSCCCWH